MVGRSIDHRPVANRGARAMIQKHSALQVTKNTLALFTSKGVSLLFSFAFVVFAARYLGVGGFGRYSLVQNYFNLLMSLAVPGVGMLIARDIALDSKLTSQRLSMAAALVAGLTAVLGGILLALADIVHYPLETRLAILIACLALLPASISQVLEFGFIGLEKAEYVTYVNLAESILRMGASILILRQGYGLIAVFIILVTSRSAMLGLYVLLLRRLYSGLHWEVDRATWRPLLATWRVFAAENWLFTFYSYLDVVILSSFYGDIAVGIYAAAAKILTVGQALATSLAMGLYPHLVRQYQKAADRFYQLISAVLQFELCIIVPCAIIITVMADRTVSLLYGDRFGGAAGVLAVLSWALTFKFVNVSLSNQLFAGNKQMQSLKTAAATLAIYLPAAFWLTKTWGAEGAALAVLLSSATAFSFYFYYTFRRHAPLHVLMAFGKVIAAGVMMAAFMWTTRRGAVPLVIGIGLTLDFLILLLLRVVPLRGIIWVRGAAQQGVRKVLTHLANSMVQTKE